MSTNSQNANFIEALKNIEDFYIDNALTVWCPVADINLKFKPLSIQQIKQFIELQVSIEKDEYGIVPGLTLLHKLNVLIQENCLDKVPELLKTLSTVDRDAILLQLRANTKSTLEIQEGETPVEVDLKEVLSNLKSCKFSKKLRTRNADISSGSTTIDIKMEIPSIHHDNGINDYFVNNIAKPQLQKGRKQVEGNVEKLLSNVYMVEMSKYISQIAISKDTSKTVIDFRDIDNVENNIQILEKLPTTVLSEISLYIKDIKKYRDSVLSYTSTDNNKRIPIDIDIAFFTSV